MSPVPRLQCQLWNGFDHSTRDSVASFSLCHLLICTHWLLPLPAFRLSRQFILHQHHLLSAHILSIAGIPTLVLPLIWLATPHLTALHSLSWLLYCSTWQWWQNLDHPILVIRPSYSTHPLSNLIMSMSYLPYVKICYLFFNSVLTIMLCVHLIPIIFISLTSLLILFLTRAAVKMVSTKYQSLHLVCKCYLLPKVLPLYGMVV